MSKKIYKQPYIYLLLGIISLVGVTGIADFGAFSRYCGIIIRLWSLWHFCLLLAKGQLKGPIVFFTLFVLLLIAYSIVSAIQGQTYEYIDSYRNVSTMTAFNYLNLSWMYACPVYSFYWFTRKGYIDKNFILSITICGVIYSIFLFFHINSIYVENSYGALSGNTNNSSYVFLHLFPLLIFFKDKIRIQYVLLFILVSAIVISSKRGALLTALICLPIFLKGSINVASNNKKRIIIMSFISLIVIFFIVRFEFVNNSYFNERIRSFFEGDSSGRDDIFSILLDYYRYNFDFNEQLFGKGIYSTLSIAGNYAHNDWLEYLICFGFIGFFVYALYMFSLFYFYNKTKTVKNEHSKAYLMTIIILFMSSLFSMSFSGMSIFISFSLGYTMSYLVLNMSNRAVRNININKI